jgi:hypothetical protein
MRVFVAALTVFVLMAPADAKKRKHSAAPAPAKVRVVHDDSFARDAMKAEEQLAELRSGKELAAPAQEPVSSSWVAQENDKEVPAGLREKKK